MSFQDVMQNILAPVAAINQASLMMVSIVNALERQGRERANPMKAWISIS